MTDDPWVVTSSVLLAKVTALLQYLRLFFSPLHFSFLIVEQTSPLSYLLIDAKMRSRSYSIVDFFSLAFAVILVRSALAAPSKPLAIPTPTIEDTPPTYNHSVYICQN